MSTDATNPLLYPHVPHGRIVADGEAISEELDGTTGVRKKAGVHAEEIAGVQGLPTPPLWLHGAANTYGVPDLPPVEGRTAVFDRDADSKVIEWLQTPFASLAMMINVMADLAGDEMIFAGKTKNYMNKLMVTAQEDAARATIEQVQGERESAAWKLGAACIAVVAVAAVSLAGGAMSNSLTRSGFMTGAGAAMAGAGMVVGQLVNAMGTYFDTATSGGGQYKADEAKIKKALLDIRVQVFKNQEENLNNLYDDQRKNTKTLLNEVARSLFDKENQAIQSINANI